MATSKRTTTNTDLSTRNIRAERLIYSISQSLFNYFGKDKEAIPSPTNAVRAVNNSERAKHGGANVSFKYTTSLKRHNGENLFGLAYYRVETNVFYNTLSIPSSKVPNINCGLIFGDPDKKQYYISDDTSWLTDPLYERQEDTSFATLVENKKTGELVPTETYRTFSNYNIRALLHDERIKEIRFDNNTFSVVTYLNMEKDKASDFETYKLKDMQESCEFRFIQQDGRAPKTIYYSDGKSWRASTFKGLSTALSNRNKVNYGGKTKFITPASARNKLQRLYTDSQLLDRAVPFIMDGKTYYLGYKKDLAMETTATTATVETATAMGPKLKRKFSNNYSRHGEQPGKKWSDTEKELYKTYCETKKAKEQITEELNDANEVVGTIFDDKDAKDYRENLQKQLETVNEALKDEPKTEDTEDYFEMKKKFNFKPHREYKEQKAVCYF